MRFTLLVRRKKLLRLGFFLALLGGKEGEDLKRKYLSLKEA